MGAEVKYVTPWSEEYIKEIRSSLLAFGNESDE
jgi:hypothetical protein